MIAFMETHTLFARSQITKLWRRGKEKYDAMWNKLTNILNDCEGVTKSVKDWKKVCFKTEF